MLAGAGFKEVFSMSGGIDAWNGLKAHGAPESGMAVFSDADTIEDMVGLAWILEDGSREFYAGVAAFLEDAEAAKLFQELVQAEEKHKKSLILLYQFIAGAGLAASFFHRAGAEDLMEGGVCVSKALEWAQGKNAREILEFSMSVETNAYDLYLKMIRRIEDDNTCRIFKNLASEEKIHLEKMGELLEKRI
jgi:rubrerythrin